MQLSVSGPNFDETSDLIDRSVLRSDIDRYGSLSVIDRSVSEGSIVIGAARMDGPERRRRISWTTTFSVGVNLALAAMLAMDIFSKPQSTSNNLCMPGTSSSTTPRISMNVSDHVQMCSGNGHYVTTGECHCHACFSGAHCGDLDPDCNLDVSIGDPTLFEEYWMAQPGAEATVIPAWQGMSYFSHRTNSYLFVDYYLEQAIRSIHGLVGNAVTEGRFVVPGVGSTQLYQAALYALTSRTATSPTSVVSTNPHYSTFEMITKYFESKRYKWAGDAEKFKREAKDDEPYIELVTSPNNPCGSMNKPVVNGRNGIVVNDLAYYWPQYTPITAPADFPVMLWTLSKISGHAGTRLGWAIVKDARVAAEMAFYIQMNTLGSSHDAQQRGISLLRNIMSSYAQGPHEGPGEKLQPFFHSCQAVLEDRWRRLRQALRSSSRLEAMEYDSEFCTFLGKTFQANPAFLWLKCKAEEDCGQLLKEHKIIVRSGPAFGVSLQYARLSMLDRHPLFDMLLARLASIK